MAIPEFGTRPSDTNTRINIVVYVAINEHARSIRADPHPFGMTVMNAAIRSDRHTLLDQDTCIAIVVDVALFQIAAPGQDPDLLAVMDAATAQDAPLQTNASHGIRGVSQSWTVPACSSRAGCLPRLTG